MNTLFENEIAYLESQRLGRLATVGASGQPHVVPVTFRYNRDSGTIDIGGHNFAQRKKYRDVLKEPRVALVVDDIASVEPWHVRGVEIRGRADVLLSGGEQVMPGFDPEMFRIIPSHVSSWGL